MPTPRNQSKGQVQAGFTMVELLVVITIIAILAGLLMPAVIGAMRRAHETKTLNLIHQCEIAALAYYNDHGDYPPSTWAELLGDPALVPPAAYAPNEGIEVLTACLASRNGGPYLDFSNDVLDSTDEEDTDLNGIPDVDVDDGTIAAHVNWYFRGIDTDGDAIEDLWRLFEIVDFWGNPLVYIHNRDYMAHDGWNGDPDDEDLDGDPVDPTEFEAPPSTPTLYLPQNTLPLPWASSEPVPYVDSEGNLRPCYARSASGFVTQNYPNLDSFQLYSWGPDALPGCAGTAGLPGYATPNPSRPGICPGWDKNSRNLTNWQE